MKTRTLYHYQIQASISLDKQDTCMSKETLDNAEEAWREELERLLANHGLEGTVQTELVSWHAEEVLPESD